MLFHFIVALVAAQDDPRAYVPSPEFPADLIADLNKDPVQNFLSATLGNHMVLQRAPQSAIVWGHTSAGATVTTTFGVERSDIKVQTMTTKAGADGIWRQVLPPTEASYWSTAAYSLTFKSSSGETAALADVLFGDVFVCGGQSNMQFSMGAVENATEEIAKADNYPHIRLFTVGQKTSSAVPLEDLQTIEEAWAVSSKTSVAGRGGFGYFSAVCWFFGRQIADAQTGVPLGLISNNWGGTPVEAWSAPDAFAQCKRQSGARTGNLYNAMIHPYTIGPMAVTGFTWYQGEANTHTSQSATEYGCLFPAMITSWRTAFKNPDAYFGFVQLSTWCTGNEAVAEMREAQMQAVLLPKVGYATNADHGAGCNIHPPPKQYCGARLGNSALALQYAHPIEWRSPTYESAVLAAAGASLKVTFKDATALELRPAANLEKWTRVNCTAMAGHGDYCAFAELEVNNAWVSATVTVEGASMVLTSTVAGKITGASYGWGAIPILTVYDSKSGLPVLPFREACTAETQELIV